MNISTPRVILLVTALITAFACNRAVLGSEREAIRKVKDLIIYEDARFYSSFPSIIRRPDGELIVAFRRAPDRRAFGQGISHTDPNSTLVLVRSKDRGVTWSREPELIYAHPFGGSQDPCMVQLRNSTILCTSYAWALMKPDAISKLKQPISRNGDFVFLGGFILESDDGARTWKEPVIPPPCRGEPMLDIFGQPVPAFNRGAMCEGKDGRLFWVVASSAGTNAPNRTGTHLLISRDKGKTWNYSCPVAHDERITFNECSMYETPNGDLVAFTRTDNFGDHTVIARSTDHGRSFRWTDSGFVGHPHYALQLPDKRVLLVYGFRHAPFGVRARVLDPECTNASTSHEIVLRDDGGNGDLGYPWAAMIDKHRALVVYYFNKENAVRHIAATELFIP